MSAALALAPNRAPARESIQLFAHAINDNFLAYTYDDLGRRIGLIEWWSSGGAASYGYDALDRLQPGGGQLAEAC